MDLTVAIGGARYALNVKQPKDISVPVRFGGDQLSVFGAPPARKEPYVVEGFVGDVGRGGSCNCDMLSFAPHLHGTHTECVGHITDASVAVNDILKDSLIPATLVTLAPQAALETSETYDPLPRPDDKLMTYSAIKEALHGSDPGFLDALIIRTLPNDKTKPTRDYHHNLPPFFSIEAMNYLVDLGVRHVLVDVPSIDRMDDEGKLTNHHIFWGLARGTHAVDEKNISPKTVTELIYADDEIRDGHYILNLQLAPLVVDAAPSRPLLYEIKRL